MPLHEAIKVYIQSGAVRDLLKDLEVWVDDEEFVPNQHQIRRAGVGLMKLLICRSGHRNQVYGSAFTKGLFGQACRAPPAANPYQLEDPDRHQGGAVKTWDGSKDDARVYIRENPHEPDPNDREDPMRDPDKWAVLAGRCVEITQHKTPGITVYIWFSEYLHPYLFAYDELTLRYFCSQGLAPGRCGFLRKIFTHVCTK